MKIFFAMVIGAILVSPARADDSPREDQSRRRALQLVALTGDQDYADEERAWDLTYSRKDYVFGKEPSDFLTKNIDKLPKGRALDIAMGEGRNTVYLAKKGFIAEGVDISAVGLRKAEQLAREHRVRIHAINADLNHYKIKPNSYEVILNFYYLQRGLYSQIKAGLKHGGVVVFETYMVDPQKVRGGSGWEKDFLLKSGELRKAFSDFEILHYSEKNDGKNAIVSLVAQKP